MEVVPAIDLKDGRCVRLYQGDFSREEVFSEDPVEVALRWQEQGATRIHVVDLDGAASGSLSNLGPIEQIVSAVGVPVQVGGGIRSLAAAQRLVGMGVDRVVLGTSALEEPALVARTLRAYGREAIVVSIDARDGRVAVRGWVAQSDVGALDLVRQMASLGVHRFLYTDIARDGTLTEPNFEALAEVMALGEPIIAAGGIASAEHITRLASLGAEATIVGRALYVGAFTLPEALAAAEGERPGS